MGTGQACFALEAGDSMGGGRGMPPMPMHTHDLRQKFNKYMYHVHSAYERIKSTSLARKKFPSIRRGVFGYLRFIISSK